LTAYPSPTFSNSDFGAESSVRKKVEDECPAKRELASVPGGRNRAAGGHKRALFGCKANEVRLQLSVLAYNLGNLWRRMVLPKRIDHWSLTSLQQRLVLLDHKLLTSPWRRHSCLPRRDSSRPSSPHVHPCVGTSADAADSESAPRSGGSGGRENRSERRRQDGEVSEKCHWEEVVQVRTPTPDGQNGLFWAAGGRWEEKPNSNSPRRGVWCILPTGEEPKMEIPAKCILSPLRRPSSQRAGVRRKRPAG
jgi:hypothetical protein